MIVAKMRCSSVRQTGTEAEPQESVELQAVYSDDPANVNSQWSKWTPSGSLVLNISNPGAQGQLQEGAEYMVTLRPAEAGE